jgi:hypothetical protein
VKGLIKGRFNKRKGLRERLRKWIHENRSDILLDMEKMMLSWGFKP